MSWFDSRHGSNSNTIDVAKDNTIITSNENVLIEKVFEIEPFWLDTNQKRDG